MHKHMYNILIKRGDLDTHCAYRGHLWSFKADTREMQL